MTDKVERKLIDYIQDAHSMERNVLKMLDSMIATTEDEKIRADLRHHHGETERHISLMKERLEAHGESPSKAKDALAVAGTAVSGMLMKAMAEITDDDDRAAKNARNGFVTEHMEIAAYELLERIATHAGDPATADAARRNLADERAMAGKIAQSWDRVVALTVGAEHATPAATR